MLRIPGFLLMALLFAAPAQALVIDLTADLEAENVVPPTDSLAFGTGVFQYDDETNVLTWTILFTASLLDSEEVSAGVSGPAAVGENADALFDLGTGQLKQGMADLDTIASCTGDPEACEDDLLAGLWYVTISSTEHPDGEIRGQIVPAATVPEPMAMSLLMAAAGGVLLRRRLAA